MTGEQAHRATPFEILCLLCEQRGWTVKLGVLEPEHGLATGRLGPPRKGEHAILADLRVERRTGTLEAPGFLGAGNLQDAAAGILAELEREGVFKP